jgi:3-phenylpropionate/trans-cinnamate dioxygenase ferredoxin subunit
MSAPTSRPARRYVVGKVADVPDGERIIVDVNGRSIGIFNVGGEFFALLNRCPHAGAEMCRGDVVGEVSSERPGEYHFDGSRRFVVCPWHGWEFDLRTGRSYFDPQRTRVRRYPIEVQPGSAVRTPGPYQAETLEISVEDDYLVVDLSPPRRTP